MSITPHTACVAGGTSGIGRALTLRLLAEGWTVFAIGRNPHHAEQIKNEAMADGESGRLHVTHGDLRNYSLCEEIASRISQESASLNLLVNAAGTIGAGGVLAENPERWDLFKPSLERGFSDRPGVCNGGGCHEHKIHSMKRFQK